jgi:hypothetical protein
LFIIKLKREDIEFSHVRRAVNDGKSPAVTFRIINFDAVSQFINQSSQLGFLRGNRLAAQAARLNYQLNEDNSEITIRRSVGPQTLAFASNQSLADAVLTLIYDEQIGEREDIYTGLTSQGLAHYQSSPQIQSFYQNHYQIECVPNSRLSQS